LKRRLGVGYGNASDKEKSDRCEPRAQDI
jgi:hypothetical protein